MVAGSLVVRPDGGRTAYLLAGLSPARGDARQLVAGSRDARPLVAGLPIGRAATQAALLCGLTPPHPPKVPYMGGVGATQHKMLTYCII